MATDVDAAPSKRTSNKARVAQRPVAKASTNTKNARRTQTEGPSPGKDGGNEREQARNNWPNAAYGALPYECGMRVEYMFEDRQGIWYAGEVMDVPNAVSIRIRFDDGDMLMCAKFSARDRGKLIGVRPEKRPDVPTRTSNDRTATSSSRAVTLPLQSTAKACQHCDWFKNIHINFDIIANLSAPMHVEHVEARTVKEVDGRWRHCHLLKPSLHSVPSKTLSKLQEKGGTCIVLWFGKEEYEGLDFDYSIDKAGTLRDGDDEKIFSRKMTPVKESADDIGVKHKKRSRDALGGEVCSRSKVRRTKKSSKKFKRHQELPLATLSSAVKVPGDAALSTCNRWIQCTLCKKWRIIDKSFAQSYHLPNISWFCWYDDKLDRLSGDIPERACTAAVEVCTLVTCRALHVY